MSQQPLVTVYMPTKNRLALLKRAIASVEAQTLDNWELIVVNDASTDDTAAYLEQLGQENPKVRALHNDSSIGACASRNKAIEAARGTYITGLDDDDEFLPERLEKMVEAYSDEYAYVCSGAYWVTDTTAKPILATDKVLTPETELYDNHAGNQVLTTKAKFLAVGGFDKEFVSLQDYECFYRLVEHYGKAKRIATPLMKLHVAHGEVRISSSSKSVKGFDQFMQKHGHKMKPSQKYRFRQRRLARMRKKLSFSYALQGLLSKLYTLLGR